MKNRPSWINPLCTNFDEWNDLCPPGEYRIVSPSNIPSPVPSGLLAKTNTVIVQCMKMPQGSIVFMANHYRIESKRGEIDQEPFAIVFLANDTTSSGVLIHHGNWDGRTTTPPVEFWDAVTQSGIECHYPLPNLPTMVSGSLESLPTSEGAAFNIVLKRLRKHYDV